LLAGVMLLLMGFAHMGRLIQYIPHPVTTGFTSGIAVVIATLQLKDFFGLRITELPEGFFAKLQALLSAAPSASPVEFSIGTFTLALLFLWPRLNKRIPAPLVALSAV